MARKWCHNAKTGEIFDYIEYNDGTTDFPRGTFIVYDDYLTVGISSKEKAIEWAKEWGCCDKCKGSSKPKEDGSCFRCGEPVIFHEIKIVP
jgi:hypothetical protein